MKHHKTPDFIPVATEGQLDSVIRHLRKGGLEIPGLLKLHKAAGYWNPNKVPDFLKVNGDTEMYERLESLSIATYRKLGHAQFFLKQIRDMFGSPYELPRSIDPKDRIGVLTKLMELCARNEIPRQATFDAFVTSLVSALDSFAGMSALLLNLPYSIWNVHFNTLTERTLRQSMTLAGNSPREKFLAALANVVIRQYVGVGGRLADWCKQLHHYRNAAAHRPSLFAFGHTDITSHKVKLDQHLILDTFGRASDALASPGASMPEQEFNQKADLYMDQTVEDYCNWVFKHVVEMISKACVVLADVYEQRAKNPSLLINDPARLLKRTRNQQPTDFKGL